MVRQKPRRRPKQTVILRNIVLDAEWLKAITILWRSGIDTEHSCAGVSLSDEPVDHSLYAYLTIPESERATRFVRFTMERLQHRVLITYEPHEKRYDLSSFFIQHNRSFCYLMERCALNFATLDPG
ncbi:hypothetical protein [Paenibacillus lycopersici]|uniref:hypothetical protein n=1 Tax=Paenibacillus lycopersici TaxID=2704462 RepID=UPI001CDCAABD|nr:hypothetical protein [Paenibacillus lycopersici]